MREQSLTVAIHNRSKSTTRGLSRVFLGAVTLQCAVLGTPAASEEVAPVWQSSCTGKDRTTPLTCVIEQTLVVSASGALIGKAEVRVPDKGSQPLLLLLVPLGVDVRVGLRLRCDDAELANVTIQTCSERGCLAAFLLVKSSVGALRKGNAMTMSFRGAGKPEVTTSFKLSGFSEAFGKIE
jgi:invasion protein IalB